MTRHSFRRILVISLLGLLFSLPAVSQAQQEPVVRAVLFYSPTCPHCHQVINELLIPMVEEHGDRLQIVAVDVTQAGGQLLYQSAIEHFEIPEERLGVPTLVVGDTVLVGGGEIPAQFPDIVSQGLVTGIDWPAIPNFVPPDQEAEAEAQATTTVTPTASVTPPETATAEPSVSEEATVAPVADQDAGQTQPTPDIQSTRSVPVGQTAPLVLDGTQPEIVSEEAQDPPADPVGFALAAAILVAMVIACVYVTWRLFIPVVGGRNIDRIATAPDLSWAIPLIAGLGIGVAAYLAYVEVAQVTAVCGPVGHCNVVQSSAYARILGIPIAILGVASYVAVIPLWFVERLVKQDKQKITARIGLIGLTIFATLFSIYLTLLELFVIQAVCAWCLTSAIFMTLLMVLTVRSVVKKPELAVR